jgi:hypothetical protein
MTKRPPFIWTISILLLASLACGLSDLSQSVPTLLPAGDATQTALFLDQVNTAQAGTLMALTPGGSPLPGQATPTVFIDPTQPTLLTVNPGATQTPNRVTLTVSKQTFCRTGPAAVYDALGTLDPGQEAEVLGQDPPKLSWYIRLPSNTSILCWVWGGFATPSGDVSRVLVLTPMPTPTPKYTATPVVDFTVTYAGTVFCAPTYLKFAVTNTSSVIWRSYRVDITDTVDDTLNPYIFNGFYDFTGCVITNFQADLGPGESGVVMWGAMAASHLGHPFIAEVRLCSEAFQTGTCLTKTLNFTP